MGTNWPWNWRVTVLKTIKMMVIRPWHDQFQDACQSWLCCFCMWPPLSAYKSSCPLIVSGRGGVGLWTWSRPPPPPLPCQQLPTSKIKRTFFSTNLASWVLALEQPAARPCFQQHSQLWMLTWSLWHSQFWLRPSAISILLGGRKVMVPVALQQML